MGIVKYLVSSVDCPRDEITEKLDYYISLSSCDQSTTSLPEPVQWHETVYDSYKDAIDALKEMDSPGAQIAVQYKKDLELDQMKKSEELIEIEQKISSLNLTLKHLAFSYYFKDYKGPYIVCPHCKAKWNPIYNYKNYCGICFQDLRPKSFIVGLQFLHDSIIYLKELSDIEYCKCLQKFRETHPPVLQWAIKIEY